MIPRGSQSRDGTPITLIAIHTAEGARTTASLVAYLDQPGIEASYHVVADDTTTVTYLPDDVACWALLSGNPRAVQLCFTGFAAWPRGEWLAHDRMLRQGAAVVARWCRLYRIPARHLTLTELTGGQSGVIGHWDWTRAKHDGTHTDPGPNFPWDVFITYVKSATRKRNHMGYLIEPTPIPIGAKPGDRPAGGWETREYTLTSPGPAGGWPGRVLMHWTPGFLGAFVEEAWSRPSGNHFVTRYDPEKKTGGQYVDSFASQDWELPKGDTALILRLATRAIGSAIPETQN